MAIRSRAQAQAMDKMRPARDRSFPKNSMENSTGKMPAGPSTSAPAHGKMGVPDKVSAPMRGKPGVPDSVSRGRK